jgi:hypothetical protein
MTEQSEKNAGAQEVASEPQAPSTGANLLDAPVITMPKFVPHAGSASSGTTEQASTTPIRQTYDQVQESATGPGVQEWRQVDKLRADLSQLYRTLQEDSRYAESYKSETAWRRYEEVREQVEQLAPEARTKMLKSAEGLERLSIPTPEGEALVTKDMDRLQLSAHERTRVESLLTRSENARGPLKRNPHDILRAEYERALDEGGPSGGATVRAVVSLARDYGYELDKIVDSRRRDSHHGALESAERRYIQAQMVGRSVPQPPFPHPARMGSGNGGDFHTGRGPSGASAFVNNQGVPLAARGSGHVDITRPKNRKPSWK